MAAPNSTRIVKPKIASQAFLTLDKLLINKNLLVSVVTVYKLLVYLAVRSSGGTYARATVKGDLIFFDTL